MAVGGMAVDGPGGSGRQAVRRSRQVLGTYAAGSQPLCNPPLGLPVQRHELVRKSQLGPCGIGAHVCIKYGCMMSGSTSCWVHVCMSAAMALARSICVLVCAPPQAGIFQYAKRITDEQAGESVVDAVITVPVWMGMAQRQAIMDAAKLGGLNVLGLVNTHAAAALQFGIERDFSKKEQTVGGLNKGGQVG